MRRRIKRLFFIPCQKAGEGFSIVGLLVSLSIILITTIGISNGLALKKRTQNDISVRQSATKFQDMMRSETAKTARNFILDDCSGTRYGYVPGNTNANSGSTFSQATPLSLAFGEFKLAGSTSEGTAKMSYSTNITAITSEQAAAATRCRSPKNKATAGTGDYMYFCMKFEADSNFKTNNSANTNSFWNLENSFIEVILMPVELGTDKPIKCSEMEGDGAHGVRVIYSVQYANKTGQKRDNQDVYIGKEVNGVFYVSGEQ